MIEEQPNNPLHGIKLITILEELYEHFGWQVLGDKIQKVGSQCHTAASKHNYAYIVVFKMIKTYLFWTSIRYYYGRTLFL